MGNNDKHFWVSTEHRKRFWDQGNSGLRYIREQVVLLIGDKGGNQKGSRDHGTM